MRQLQAFQPTEAVKRNLEFLIKILIVASVIAYSVETLPDLPESVQRFLAYFEIFTVVVFTIEYFARVYYAEKKRRFIFSFFGLIDLLSILPFYLSLGIDVRALRSLRLFRLFRLLKLARYSHALIRFKDALLSMKEEFVLFFMITGCLLYFAAVGIYHFENEAQPEVFSSIFHSLWWAVATLTTVGYGDVFPITTGGRIFTFVVLMIGLGIVAVPAGLVATAMTEAMRKEEQTQE